MVPSFEEKQIRIIRQTELRDLPDYTRSPVHSIKKFCKPCLIHNEGPRPFLSYKVVSLQEVGFISESDSESILKHLLKFWIDIYAGALRYHTQECCNEL